MTKHNKQSLESVLVICDENINPEGVSRLFENQGFPVRVSRTQVEGLDFDHYGAIVYVAWSADSLDQRLGERLEKIRDEEWILVAGSDEDDLHCTAELTAGASSRLRLFVRSLWSTFSIA